MKRIIKAAALFLAAAIMLTMLFACSSEAVYTLTVTDADGTEHTYEMTYAEYKVYMSMYKFLMINNQDLYYYSYYGYKDSSGNTILEGAGDGMFTDDLDSTITGTVQGWIKNVVAERYLAEKYGVTATEEQKATNENYVNQLVKRLGGMGSFKQKMGCTPAQYLTFCESDNIHDNLYEYLYGDNGIIEVDDKDADDYYQNNYYAFRYLVVDLKNEVELDEEGNRVMNDAGTEYKRTSIDESTDEGKEKLSDKGFIPEKIKSELAVGTSFVELIEKYSDEYTSVKYAESGVIYSEYTDGVILSFDDAILTTLASLKTGEVSDQITTVSENYVYFVERLDLPEKAYADEEYAQWFVYEDTLEDAEDDEEKETVLVNAFDDLVRDYLYDSTVEALVDTIVSDDEQLAKCTIKSAFMPKITLSRTSS
ncbi:MAG: hypothetical protein J5940_01765 [Clostridia bacterium]|nr:hypothetical protein [Clostridia bacterium]